jgi:hypothetical protein
MLNIGDKVGFFSLDEEFSHVDTNTIEEYLNTLSWYKIIDMGDAWLDVKSSDESRTVHVDDYNNEYQVFTKEDLRKHLLSLNHSYVAICNKIKQLYRKQDFQFKGIYQ